MNLIRKNPNRLSGLYLLLAAGLLPVTAGAVTIVSGPDTYSVRANQVLQVEAPGVLNNDTVDGQPADGLANAVLVADVSFGSLSCPGVGPGLCADGSFDYLPGAAFTGLDSFTYRAASGGVNGPVTTVAISACTAGPVIACWQRAAFDAKLNELGLASGPGLQAVREGFDGADWNVARTPVTVASLDTQGVHWTTNHPETRVTTGSGIYLSPRYGGYDLVHGYPACMATASCSTSNCDINNPPEACLYHDGLSGSPVYQGAAFRAVGVDIRGTNGAAVAFFLGDVNPVQVGFDHAPDLYYKFFGVIDTQPAGFNKFEIRELNSKYGQQINVWFDDFDLVIEGGIQADGDLAPRGAPDGVVNWADYLLALQMSLGIVVPTAEELAHADLYPADAPDGRIDLSDLLLLRQRIGVLP